MPYKDLEKKKQWRKNNKALIQKHTDDWLKRNGHWGATQKRRVQLKINIQLRQRQTLYRQLCTVLTLIYSDRVKHICSTRTRKRSVLSYFNERARDNKKSNRVASEVFTAQDFIKVYDKFKWVCFICNSIDRLAVDHHWPRRFNTILKDNNAVVLCEKCNASKHNKEPSIFYTPKQLSILHTQYGITKEVYSAKD